jgi:hypothetical protein
MGREMTVRCKSGISDSFIEQPGITASLGGMFIATPHPSAPGTLLKFEVMLPGNRGVAQGVGRVLWRREGPASDAEHPSGMGLKLIKLADGAGHIIGRLLEGQGKKPRPSVLA